MLKWGESLTPLRVFLFTPDKKGFCPRISICAKQTPPTLCKIQPVEQHYAACCTVYYAGIYLRPILGHTPRKLPLRASPQSNLSLHRISSPIIIQHCKKKCKSFFIFFITIFHEDFHSVLCMLHKFCPFLCKISPICVFLCPVFAHAAGINRGVPRDFCAV